MEIDNPFTPILIGMACAIFIMSMLTYVAYRDNVENIQCRDYGAKYMGNKDGFARCAFITTNADGSVNITEKLYPYKQLIGG